MMGAALFLAASLAACGGGGGGGTGGGGGVGVIPTPTPTPTSTPTPAATLNPYGCVGSTPYATVARRPMIAHPIAAGDSFTYSGTISDTRTQSAPCAQPTATSAATVSVSVAASATTMPDASAGSDFKSTEADAFPTLTQTTITDLSVKSTASQFLLYAEKNSDTNGNSADMIYTVPQLLDRNPEASGSWGASGSSYFNNPAGTFTENLADGTAVSRTIAADGSYIDTETFPGGAGTATITVNGAVNARSLDGSGSYGLAGATFSYAAPAAGSITLTITQPGSTKTRTFPAWFSSPGSTSYISDGFADSGPSLIDAGCTVDPAAGATGEKVIETHSVLDPVLGYQDTRVTTSYNVSGFGAVCVKIDDTLKSYYDYTNDTTKIDYQSQNGSPNSVDDFVEFLSMTSTSSYPAVRTASARTQGVSPLSVAAHISALELRREVQRAQRVHALHDILLRNAAEGGAR
ncbi:MAG: hypothetical protein ABR508_08355 [Candidatus Baltobacteraceae bacterium]